MYTVDPLILDATGQLFTIGNPFVVEHIRKGIVISREIAYNGITTAGKNSLFDVYFRNQTQLPNWYFGLINNAGFSALSAADTSSSHAGWTEFIDISDSNRPAWVPDAAASASITNSSATTINIDDTGTVYGVFVISNNTIGGTTGVLWSTAAFASPKSVVATDQIKLTYTLNA